MTPLQDFAFGLPLPVFSIDGSGLVVGQNKHFSDLMQEHHALGIPFSTDSVAALLRQTEGRTSPCLTFVESASGFRFEVSALRTDDGVVCALMSAPAKAVARRPTHSHTPLLSQSGISQVILDQEGNVVFANSSFEELTGYLADECIGKQLGFLRSSRHGENFYDDVWTTIRAGTVYSGIVFNEHKNGRLIICEEVISPVRNEMDEIEWYIITDRDLTEQLKLETKLRQSKEHLQRIIEWAPLGVAVFNARGEAIEVNAALAGMLGYRREELQLSNIADLTHPDDCESALDRMARLEAGGGQSYSSVRRLLRKDGGIIWTRVHFALLPHGPEGGESCFIGMIEDITDSRLGEKKLQATLSELQDLQESIDAVALRLQMDGRGIVQSVNENFLKLVGRSAAEIVGFPISRDWLRVPETDYKDLVRAMERGRLWKGEIEIVSERGLKHWLDTMLIPRVDEGGEVKSVRMILFDVTLRKRAEEAIVHQAFHDSLTGLPNRALLLDRLFTAISRARRMGDHLAVLFLDLDRFKSINDTLGHAIGDRLLKRASDRLQSVVREYDTVARTGGDEFVLLLSSLGDVAEVVVVVERIQELMSQPFEIDGHELCVPTSVGISVFPEDGADPDTLIKNADVALYRAKEMGRNCFIFYNAEQNVYSHERLALENEMRRALRENQFCLFFQPQIDLASGKLAGFETLARWQHPVRGLVPPGVFIPIAEETGMILPLGDQVLRDSFRTAAEWHGSQAAAVHLSVNISGRQFYQKRFLADLLTMRDQYHLPAGCLELEITETIAMQMTPATMDILWRLRQEGFTIALDDFGTGYSSLKYLREFPLDILKIDRSFIMDLEKDSKKQNILRSIMDLARSLDLKIVAEGVELESQLDVLKQMGCHRVQGYYYSPPVSEQDALQFFSRTFS